MQTDTLTIERFLTQKAQTPAVKRMLESLNASPELVVQILARYFTDMGIYAVHPGQEKAVLAAMVTQLKTSPDLRNAVPKPAKKSLKFID